MLTRYRAQPDAVYDGGNFTPVKEAIRGELLDEQGFLCCYCMSRIMDKDSLRVEHWHCQTNYPAEQLDYGNLLGACHGNEGHRPKEQYCDVRKGDRDLIFNPANPAHKVEERVRYLGDGRITSPDALFNEQLEEVLNLNWTRFRQNRAAVIKAVQQALGRGPGTRTRREIKRLHDFWSRKEANGRLREFCGVAAYWLRKRLQRG